MFKKIAKLQPAQDFAFALIAGNLFANDDTALEELLNNKIPIPLTTYYTIGTTPFPQKVIDRLEAEQDVCENLHFLGKRSTTKTSDGVRLVTLGGLLNASVASGLSEDKYAPTHTTGDAKALYGANSADILLTTTWPASIQHNSEVFTPGESVVPEAQQHIAELCVALKPRYHFSRSTGFAFEREPFFHKPTVDDPDSKFITRFLSLAEYGNATKSKALFAFSLSHTVDHLVPLPSNITICPFTRPSKRAALDIDPYSRFHGREDSDKYRDSKRPRGRRGERQPPPTPDQCFFCLGKRDVPDHLLTSVGAEVQAYLTMSKGPLTTIDTFKQYGLEFPAHVLIIPVGHTPEISSLPDEGETTKQGTWAEMNRYKDAIQNMIAKKSANKLGLVTFEISRRSGVHTHWQCVPMAAEKVEGNIIEAGFRVEGEQRGYPAFELRDPGIHENEGDFFRVWLWTPPSESAPKGSTKCITMPLDDGFRFDLQFGRSVLAMFLGLENRKHWKDCPQTMEEELADVEAFKQAFEEFDFS